jgi:hypothetical protein
MNFSIRKEGHFVIISLSFQALNYQSSKFRFFRVSSIIKIEGLACLTITLLLDFAVIVDSDLPSFLVSVFNRRMLET